MSNNVFDFNLRYKPAQQPTAQAVEEAFTVRESTTPGLSSAFVKLDAAKVEKFREIYATFKAYKERVEPPPKEVVLTTLGEIPIAKLGDLITADNFIKSFLSEIAKATLAEHGTTPPDQIKLFLNELQAMLLSVKIELACGVIAHGCVFVQTSFAREGHVISVIYGNDGEMYARPVSMTVCYNDPAQ